MSIPEYARANFNTPLRAAISGDLALLGMHGRHDRRARATSSVPWHGAPVTSRRTTLMRLISRH
jgi:hypothetical protein